MEQLWLIQVICLAVPLSLITGAAECETVKASTTVQALLSSSYSSALSACYIPTA